MEHSGYEDRDPLDEDVLDEVPNDLIETQPKLRGIHMNNIVVYNCYYEARVDLNNPSI